MDIMGEYSDQGKSGKSVEGREAFQQMMDDITQGGIDYVLVFKLSRFGRNAADVLTSLQQMQDYGTNLICVEDGIDSSKDSGKLVISVLSAVAEIERENILVQTMEGRKQKAREGKWNGGFAPYGYELINGELQVAEDESEIIRIIFDKFIHTTMGVNAVANYLNQHGYVKKKRQNNNLDSFSSSFVKGVLANPIYCGKIAYGRRKNEKVTGTRNDYHIVKQDAFMLHDGIHQALVSEEDWQMAQRKRQDTGIKPDKTYSLDHAHILSGILTCPVCGSRMYGNVNRKKKKDGSRYKDYFYYVCKHQTKIDGHRCDYKKQWGQDKVNGAVADAIRTLVQTPQFEERIRTKIGAKIDTSELEQELTQLQKNQRQIIGAKNKLGEQIDRLDVNTPHYNRKYDDMQNRLDVLYCDLEAMENQIETVERRLMNIRQQQISGDHIYQFLINFDKLYDLFTDEEKKTFISSFISRVELFPAEQENGQFLKHIWFHFPVFLGDREIQEIGWENESTVETVCLLSKLK